MELESIRDCNILIIEEKEDLTNKLRHKGCKKATACTIEQALKNIKNTDFNVVLLDVETPNLDTLQVIDAIHEANVDTVIILITKSATSNLVIQAMKKGAYGYLVKPVNLEELEIIGRKAIERQTLIDSNRELQKRIKAKYRFENILGISRNMQIVYETIKKVAKTNATVLIQGESGTGKALIARAIHYNSERADKPLIEVNCGSLPETLLENELFGHERGAFTGATDLKRGRFELAHSGTLFLDEVAEMRLSSQVKLLRVLQEKKFERLGGERTIQVDVRIIAATNKNLEEEMREGRFREDLYYRLNVVSINISPLRERKEDIPIFVNHFLQRFSQEHKKRIKGISQKALDEILNYSWPGNVRELENAIERAVVMQEEGIILPEHLPLSVQSVAWDNISPVTDYLVESLSLSRHIKRLERDLLLRALKKAGGNRTRASELLEISLPTFRKKIREYKLDGYR
jgi:DNA-binding NtrC family response regulator